MNKENKCTLFESINNFKYIYNDNYGTGFLIEEILLDVKL